MSIHQTDIIEEVYNHPTGVQAVCSCGWEGEFCPFDEDEEDTTTDRAWRDAENDLAEHEGQQP